VVRPANAIDFWRGFALVSIFINHIPGIYFEHFTHRNISLSDSAELFVFLAGWALRLVVGKPEDPLPTGQLIARLGGRAIAIYAAQILIMSAAIAMLATAAKVLGNPLMLEWHNAAAVFYNPVDTHIGLVLLTHQLGYFDILPLYVVLMLAAPAVALLHRYAPNWLLPISLSIYLAALSFGLTVPSWPTEGQWFFNPLAWQLIFVLGFVLARERGVSAVIRRNFRLVRMISLPIVLLGAVVAWFNWLPDPTTMPEPRLLFVNAKTFLSPMRVIQFLALVAVFSTAYPYIEHGARPLAEYLSMLGRNSLEVFCVASLLSLAGQIVRFAYGATIATDAVIVLAGITVLGVTAWVSEWRQRAKSRA
jgi:hypothetical protein